MKYIVLFENEKPVFHVPAQTFPFVPVVGDTITNNGIVVLVLKRSFEFSEADAQWVGELIVRKV